MAGRLRFLFPYGRIVLFPIWLPFRMVLGIWHTILLAREMFVGLPGAFRIVGTYNLRNLYARRVSNLLTVVVIALVVAIFVGVMSLATGLESLLVSTGDPLNVITIRDGSQSETNSAVRREEASILSAFPGIATNADGSPLLSREVMVLNNLERRDGGTTNVIMRGMDPAGLLLREKVRIVEGRMFRKGLGELAVSRKISERFKNLRLGEGLRFGKRDWKVVGIFDAAGTAYDSEIWADTEDLMSDFGRPVYSSIYVRASAAAQVPRLVKQINDDQRLEVEAMTEPEYYDRQTFMAGILKGLGSFLALVLATGAAFAAMNTMYAAVSARTREIATMRALGFSAGSIMDAFVIEALALAAIGGILGGLLSLPVNGLSTGTANFATFAEIAFAFRITPGLLASGLVFSLIIGFFGGLLPSRLAARQEIPRGLREI